MKVFLSVALIISILFFSILIGACGDDDDSSNSSSDDDDVDDDADDDADDDVNDDQDDDDSNAREYAPAPSNDNGIFVSKTGSDENPGTMQSPKLTITEAVEVAEFQMKSVFVAEGEYFESVETKVSLFGGYEPIDWNREMDEFPTTVSAVDYGAIIVVGNTGDKFTVIEGLNINGQETTPENQVES